MLTDIVKQRAAQAKARAEGNLDLEDNNVAVDPVEIDLEALDLEIAEATTEALEDLMDFESLDRDYADALQATHDLEDFGENAVGISTMALLEQKLVRIGGAELEVDLEDFGGTESLDLEAKESYLAKARKSLKTFFDFLLKQFHAVTKSMGKLWGKLNLGWKGLNAKFEKLEGELKEGVSKEDVKVSGIKGLHIDGKYDADVAKKGLQAMTESLNTYGHLVDIVAAYGKQDFTVIEEEATEDGEKTSKVQKLLDDLSQERAPVRELKELPELPGGVTFLIASREATEKELDKSELWLKLSQAMTFPTVTKEVKKVKVDSSAKVSAVDASFAKNCLSFLKTMEIQHKKTNKAFEDADKQFDALHKAIKGAVAEGEESKIAKVLTKRELDSVLRACTSDYRTALGKINRYYYSTLRGYYKHAKASVAKPAKTED